MKEKFPKSRKPFTGRSVGSFGISEGNITRRKKNPTEYAPNPNSQRKSSPDAHGPPPASRGWTGRLRLHA